MPFTDQIAVLRFAGPFGITHQWIGPLHTIADGDEFQKVIIPVRVSRDREQVTNITFIYTGFL